MTTDMAKKEKEMRKMFVAMMITFCPALAAAEPAEDTQATITVATVAEKLGLAAAADSCPPSLNEDELKILAGAVMWDQFQALVSMLASKVRPAGSLVMAEIHNGHYHMGYREIDPVVDGNGFAIIIMDFSKKRMTEIWYSPAGCQIIAIPNKTAPWRRRDAPQIKGAQVKTI